MDDPLSEREFERWTGDHDELHREQQGRTDRIQRAFEDYRDRQEARGHAIMVMLTGTLLAALLSFGASVVFWLVTRHAT